MTCNKCTELQSENLQMREALIYYADDDQYWDKDKFGMDKIPRILIDIGDRAKQALTLPHTQKLAYRIKALEEVAKAAEQVKTFIGNVGSKPPLFYKRTYEHLNEALSKLDALEKE